MDKINFILPGFLNVSRNEIIVKIFENYPEITTSNSSIHSFFGNFPSCIWNGGRLCLGERSSMLFMRKIREFHNKHGIAVALTFTNKVLEEKHIKDKYCNKILKIFHNGENEILVSSDILEKYIREKYPKYKINKSITSTDHVGHDALNYNLTVLAVRYTNNFDYIRKIPFKDRKKLEILCNEPCKNNCKYKYTHYVELSKIQLGISPRGEDKPKDYGSCRYTEETNGGIFYYYNRNRDFYVSPSNIIGKYMPLGINKFKINGREKNHYFGYENITYYCIKTNYQMDVLTYMLERLMLEFEKEVKYQTKKYGYYYPEDTETWHDILNKSYVK